MPLYAFVFAAAHTSESWRWVTLTVVAVDIISYIVRMYIMETPKFYISVHKYNEASAVLNKVAQINSLDPYDYTFNRPTLLEKLNLEDSVDSIAPTADEPGFGDKLRKLFLSRLWRITVPLSAVWFFNGFTLSGFTLFLP